jgi:hypothetical protein
VSRALRRPVPVPPSPVLVIALEGWIDAGFAAASAVASLLETLETQQLATFDFADLIDQRARRPRLRIDDGVRGPIRWPEPELRTGSDRRGAGLLLLVGPEPDFRWQSFAAEVRELAVELDVRLVVGLGAFPTAVPHTRPIRLTSTASDPTLADRVGFIAGSLDVPAGIADVIGEECTRAGIPSVGLWARVPHYVAGMPYAPAALALVEGLAAVAGLDLPTSKLAEAADASRRQVDELIAQSEEHAAMVRQLEAQLDAVEDPGLHLGGRLPSGDEIAAELERFLRGER